MREQSTPPAAPQGAEDSRELLATLYREIGIAAVAAALRFTTQPMPEERARDSAERKPARRTASLAA